ncbi:hypothetical protein C8Q73DRAFT_761353 [Cubamyces lactineus]|nr:hypothetical protein C8Q73DRAFT_761353 [Cubamyces lactineus]
MASFLQPSALAIPPRDVQIAPQDSQSHEYGYADLYASHDDVSHMGSLDELEYPPYQALLHFEEELANNYLAMQLRYPSASADEVRYAAEPPMGYLDTSISDATLMYPSSPSSDATDYSNATYGQCFSSPVEHPAHHIGQQHSGFYTAVTSYADPGAALAPSYEPSFSGSAPISTYSTIMNALGPCNPSPDTTQSVVVAPTAIESPISTYSTISNALGSCNPSTNIIQAAVVSPADINTIHTTSPFNIASPVDPPSPPKSTGTRKSARTRHRAPSPYSPPSSPLSLSSPSASSSSSFPSSSSPSPFSRDASPPKLVSSTRRNVPASYFTVAPPPVSRSNKWKCPYCAYTQTNRRSPDLKRHIQTHTRGEDEALWVCCGVPLIDAQEEHGVPEAVAAKEPFEYEGMFMVGGCRKVFSRRDALKRHLRANQGVCFGDAMASYQPGNRIGAR